MGQYWFSIPAVLKYWQYWYLLFSSLIPLHGKKFNISIKNLSGMNKWSLGFGCIFAIILYTTKNYNRAESNMVSTTQILSTTVAVVSKLQIPLLKVPNWSQSAVNTDSHSCRQQIMLTLIAIGVKLRPFS